MRLFIIETKPLFNIRDVFYNSKYFAMPILEREFSHDSVSIVFNLLHKGGFTSKLLSTTTNSCNDYKQSIIVMSSLRKIFNFFRCTVAITTDIFVEHLKLINRNQRIGSICYNDVVNPIYGVDDWRPEKWLSIILSYGVTLGELIIIFIITFIVTSCSPQQGAL